MITIDDKSFLKSGLDFNSYIILQIIYERYNNLFKIIKTTKYFSNSITFLFVHKYIKYSGFTSIYDPEIEINDIIVLKNGTALFEQDKAVTRAVNVKNWIDEYRLKFKGIKIGSMGDKNACLKKMQLFVKNNSQYTKKDILKATDMYISNTNSIYTVQADYFISKVDNNKISTSKLLVTLEAIESGEFENINKSNLNLII